jgi:hypothetical protein
MIYEREDPWSAACTYSSPAATGITTGLTSAEMQLTGKTALGTIANTVSYG